MKKMILFAAFSVLCFSSEAQTKKSSKKKSNKSGINAQADRQARLDSLQVLRQGRVDSSIAYQVTFDSLRKVKERLADEKFLQEQTAWKQAKQRELDSANAVHWKAMSKDHEQWLRIKEQREEVNNSVKLNDYQSRQVNYINQSIFETAKRVSADSSLNEDDKKQQLVKLNEERRSRIRSVVGKAKEKKIEKARKEYKNPADKDAQWINEIDAYVKN